MADFWHSGATSGTWLFTCVFLDIFDKYYAWYEQCLNIIIENKDVSDLLDYATTFLCNPIALFSPTGKLLHYTGKFQEKIEGTLWDEVINFGFTPTESIYPDEHQRVMQEIHSGNRLISSVFRQDPSHHSLTAPLYFEGKNFGAFGTTDINGPFTEAQKALLLEVVHFTELAMNHQIQPFLLQDEENYYVIRLLQGYPADELSTVYICRTECSKVFSLKIKRSGQRVMGWILTKDAGD